jgi:hypothetical protein
MVNVIVEGEGRCDGGLEGLKGVSKQVGTVNSKSYRQGNKTRNSRNRGNYEFPENMRLGERSRRRTGSLTATVEEKTTSEKGKEHWLM